MDEYLTNDAKIAQSLTHILYIIFCRWFKYHTVEKVMNLLKLSLFSLMIVLSGCQMQDMTNASKNVSTLDLHQTYPMTEEYLLGTWQLKDSSLKGSDHKPLTLKFASLQNNSGEVLVLNGCNNLRANYQITDYRLNVGSPISTRMMCEEHLMQIDHLASKLLTGKIVLEKFVDGLPEHAYLKITLDGKEYKFTRVK